MVLRPACAPTAEFRGVAARVGEVPKRICLDFDRGTRRSASGWIIERDDDIDIEEVPPSLGTPDHLNGHPLTLSWLLRAAFGPPVSTPRNRAAPPGRLPCPHPKDAEGV